MPAEERVLRQGRWWLGMGLLLGAWAGARAQVGRSCKIDHTPANDADRAMAAREYLKAEQLYAAMWKEKPNETAAMAGVIRAKLAQGELDEALALVKEQIKDHPKDGRLEDAMGAVELRRGEPELAVQALNEALQDDPCVARTHFDVSRYDNLKGLHAAARSHLTTAHALAPEDLSISRAWTSATAPLLTPAQQIARLNERLAAPESTEEQKQATEEAIKGVQARQRGDCEPVGEVTSTKLEIVGIADGTKPMYAAGLEVQMNGKRKRLEITTAMNGLLLSRSSAISAGLVPEAEIKQGGMGDDGPTGAYVTHVDDLKIGGMEFRNCMVRVMEKKDALWVDGLIGADVFRNYLVTLDIPSREVRLGPLPKRPEEPKAAEGLATDDDEASASARPAPQDRYIAPEMKDWTSVYQVGRKLIVPTRIGNAPLKLFILDPGSGQGLISQEAAREVTRVSSDDRAHVRGINGKVKDVREADEVTLTFGGVRQRLLGMRSIDTANMSRGMGLEIAGVIGFPTLRELVLTIDYRDNLVHVVYDPNHGFHAH